MGTHAQAFSLLLLIILAVVGGFLSLLYDSSPEWAERTPTASTMAVPQPAVGAAFFAPPSPEEAPLQIRDEIRRGYNIMMKTGENAGGFVGNKLSCRNCHFEGGRMKNTISLVGAPAASMLRPQSDGMGISNWINRCFTGSLNGKPLPPDSTEMVALLSYIEWISRGIPIGADIPWVGLQPLGTEGTPDATAGEKLFSRQCTPCHGPQGLGTAIAPPLWGADSWTRTSPIAAQGKLAAFIHRFMPFGRPDLSASDSVNSAAFLLTQERPQGPGATAR